MPGDFSERRRLEQLDAPARAAWQLARLNLLLRQILPHNRFYAEKLGALAPPLGSLDELHRWPFTTKEELVTGLPGSSAELPSFSAHATVSTEAGLARNLTYPLERYVRYHRTSGTRGRPLVVLDTAADWQWWIDGWQYVLDAAQVTAADRAVLAFSFGPFIGFWSAFDAVVQRGALAVPTGGMSTAARLDTIRSIRATVVFCTPTYALRLAEVAAEQQLSLAGLGVRTLVVAGEPGGSVPATRQRIEKAWGARVVDHAGASEVGPWGYASVDDQGLHVNESELIAEFIHPGTNTAAREGELAELVLTTLGRAGCPVLRYRTGDLVRLQQRDDLECRFAYLAGGVLGRADDMLIVRGVNIFPSSIEAILHELHHVAEYRLTARRQGTLDTLLLEVEDRHDAPQAIAEMLQVRLGLSLEVRAVPLGSLPRHDGKAQRFVDQRPRPGRSAV
ncbi:MAG: phenylacetate--CoA ligase family protein [Pirellulales bacterium]